MIVGFSAFLIAICIVCFSRNGLPFFEICVKPELTGYEMAKLPALIAVMSRFEPRGANSVENLARELRRAGLITQGKRGVGAPDMSFTDVTNALFGTVSRQANQAPEAVMKLRDAVLMGAWTEQENKEADAFLDSLSISDRIAGEDRKIRAGLFVDAILEDLTRHKKVLIENDHNGVFEIGIELLDPATGDGAVKVIFWPGLDRETSLRFLALDRDAPYGIQHGAMIPGGVLHLLSAMMRGDV